MFSIIQVTTWDQTPSGNQPHQNQSPQQIPLGLSTWSHRPAAALRHCPGCRCLHQKKETKPIAKCLEMPCVTDNTQRSEPLARVAFPTSLLVSTLQNFPVLGNTLCEGCWRRHGRDAKGQRQRL